ncbi:MAG: acetyl-CoA C-acyltransferase FadI [Arenicella sp.]
MASSSNRVAVVHGLRTPFLKQASGYMGMPSRELGTHVVKELVQRSEVDPASIEQLVYGQVVVSPEAPNIAREVVMASGLPVSCDAYSVSRACATSYQSTVNIVQNILAGAIDIGIAGGADTSSDVPLTASKPLAQALLKASKAKSLGARLAAFKGIGVKHLMPKAPALKEPSSDYTMGQAAEKMAQENTVARSDQDELAHRSHINAAKAWEEGWFDQQVIPVVTEKNGLQDKDNLVRAGSELEKYAKLRPVFDRKHGSVTAGNSSPLSDGASAVLLMSEKRAKAEGYQPLGYIKSYAFAALDPNWQMLMGPSFATPIALDRAGLSLADMDLIDMHEAFAAQVISNINAFASKQFAEQYLNRKKAIGDIDMDKFNITGSSISIGHPFAATGTRQLVQILHDLRRTGGQHGLITACAAGGLGGAIIVEVA